MATTSFADVISLTPHAVDKKRAVSSEKKLIDRVDLSVDDEKMNEFMSSQADRIFGDTLEISEQTGKFTGNVKIDPVFSNIDDDNDQVNGYGFIHFKPRAFGMSTGQCIKSVTIKTSNMSPYYNRGMTYIHLLRNTGNVLMDISRPVTLQNPVTKYTFEFTDCPSLDADTDYAFYFTNRYRSGTRTDVGLKVINVTEDSEVYFGDGRRSVPVLTVQIGKSDKYFQSTQETIDKLVKDQLHNGAAFDEMLKSRSTVTEWIEPKVHNDQSGGIKRLYFRPNAFGMIDNDYLLSVSLLTTWNTIQSASTIYCKLIDPSGWPSYEVKDVSNGVVMSESFTEYTFKFSNKIKLEANKQYMLAFDTNQSGDSIGVDISIRLFNYSGSGESYLDNTVYVGYQSGNRQDLRPYLKVMHGHSLLDYFTEQGSAAAIAAVKAALNTAMPDYMDLTNLGEEYTEADVATRLNNMLIALRSLRSWAASS